MAARSFLLDKDIQQGREILLSGSSFPDEISQSSRSFSDWLESKLLDRLSEFGEFSSLSPVLIGSWSRHELSPRSDIDLIFLGDEALVRAFVEKSFKAGVKLRARTPEDREDWRVGVEPFDILALPNARMAFPPVPGENVASEGVTNKDMTGKRQNAENLVNDDDLKKQRSFPHKMRRSILSAIKKERLDRRKRQDSISNLLEPNLKFGVGGLRDIEQALALREVYGERFKDADPYPFEVLRQIKAELLFVRNLLHLNGSNDVFSAHDQLALYSDLGFESVRSLMKFISSELERASFYADWAVAYCLRPSSKPNTYKDWSSASFSEVLSRLKKDASIFLQFEVRRKIDAFNRDLRDQPKERGRLLHRAIFNDDGDDYLVALHRTRCFEVLIPDLKRLKGLVQHDHYHRYTADAHLFQALRETERIRQRPNQLGALKVLTVDLSAQDWWILKLTSLFHDLAKGRRGDHATEGAKLVERYFVDWEYPEGIMRDVQWLVENHLLLSTAAFRQNPQSPATWKRLFARGVGGRRLTLLAIFTAIDIRATNPEAWTPWKGQLLKNLVVSLRSPEAQSMSRYLQFVEKANLSLSEEQVLALDPLLLQLISPRVLLGDLAVCARSDIDQPVKVWRQSLGRSGQRVWVRFHRKVDEEGLFYGFVERLYGLGLSIQLSSIHTLPGVGVYDIFSIRTEKDSRQIAKWLALPLKNRGEIDKSLPKVQFQSIELISQDQDEWILSFRGRDQRGLLLSAARALKDEHLSLRWARAHTWGQQVDDVLSVRPLGEVEPLISRLKTRLVT